MRDWRRLPYWRTDVPVEKSIAELQRLLNRYGVSAVRTTTERDPWRLVVEWEYPVGPSKTPVIVMLDVTLDPAELRPYTPAQQAQVRNQAARLMMHTLKNLLAAVDAGLISIDEVFMPHFQTWANGQQTTVGKLLSAEIESRGALGPAIVQRAIGDGRSS